MERNDIELLRKALVDDLDVARRAPSLFEELERLHYALSVIKTQMEKTGDARQAGALLEVNIKHIKDILCSNQ